MFQAEVYNPTAIGQKARPKPMFVIQNWHRAYADALLETEATSKRDVIIATAEQMILDRHIELCDYSIPVLESCDLKHAFEVLAQLKGTAAPAECYPPNRPHPLLVAAEARYC